MVHHDYFDVWACVHKPVIFYHDFLKYFQRLETNSTLDLVFSFFIDVERSVST